MPAAQIAELLQVALRGRHDPHIGGNRLDDHRGDRVAALGEQRPDRLGVVVRGGERVPCRALGHAGRARQAERRQSRSAAFGQQRVGMPVVAALELDDQVAARDAARQPDRRHRRLGARGHETDRLDARHRIDDACGELHLALGRHAERGAAPRCLGSGRDDRGVRVAEQQGAPGLHEVDVAGALHVLDPRAFAACREHRRAADRTERAHRRVDAAGDHLLGAGEQFVVGRHGPGCYPRFDQPVVTMSWGVNPAAPSLDV